MRGCTLQYNNNNNNNNGLGNILTGFGCGYLNAWAADLKLREACVFGSESEPRFNKVGEGEPRPICPMVHRRRLQQC